MTIKTTLFASFLGISALAFSAGAMAGPDAAQIHSSADSAGMSINNDAQNEHMNDMLNAADEQNSQSQDLTERATTPNGSDQVKQSQQALRQFGFFRGMADGVMGPRTQSAIRNFQHANHLQTTGDLNDETLAALNVSVGNSDSVNSAGISGQ